MKEISLLPEAQLFVCANRREEGSPLGEGCSTHGEELFTELKRRTLTSGLASRVWVTKTACLGICPKRGATVALYPVKRFFADALVSDAETLVTMALAVAEEGTR